MARDAASSGHHADALIRLIEDDKERLLAGAFRAGSRSIMFRFPVAARHEDGDMFGAVVEKVEEQSDGQLAVHLWFWNDIAPFYATPDAKFDAWYGKTVGDGVIIRSGPE